MKFIILLASMCGLFGPVSAISRQPAQFIKGDYVEARTASVFAGACHYNSELMTSGRDAIMAWNITDGSWKGTNLSGLKVMAIVTSDSNLGDDDIRKSEIAVDSRATEAQVSALTAALEAQCGPSLGEIMAVRRATISFEHQDKQYTARADGFATLTVAAMPNDECCKQPSMVWYSPLVPLTGRKVGYTKDAACLTATLGDTWARHGENSAFYGPFTF